MQIAYGCINPDPELPAGETTDKQKQKQEELMNMFKNNYNDAKKIERLMVETLPSQRRDILSGLKETEDILKKLAFPLPGNWNEASFQRTNRCPH